MAEEIVQEILWTPRTVYSIDHIILYLQEYDLCINLIGPNIIRPKKSTKQCCFDPFN